MRVPLALALLLPLCAACGDDAPAPKAAPPFLEMTRPLGGLEASVHLSGAVDPDAATAALEEIERILRALDAHDTEGALARLAAQAGGEDPVPVGADLYGVLSLALDLARRTQGAYDPTTGAEDGGWQFVELHPPTRSVRLVRAGLALDLSGVAEGYAAQSAWSMLGAGGHPACRVQVGSVVVAGEPPQGAARWEVPGRAGGILGIARGALASSPDGAALVLAPDAPSAAAYARALRALPPDEGLAAVEGTAGVEASLRLEDGTERVTSGFEAATHPGLPAGK